MTYAFYSMQGKAVEFDESSVKSHVAHSRGF